MHYLVVIDAMFTVDDPRQVRYKYLPDAMLRIESFPFRRSILTILALVAIVLPTLHFHPADEHSHEADHADRHRVLHADFLAVLGHNHSEETADHNVHISDSEVPWFTDQINLLTLTSHNLKPDPSAGFSVFLFYEEGADPSKILFLQGFIERDHPPPIAEVNTSIGPSRSPPRSA
jgi:hypothetical protein